MPARSYFKSRHLRLSILAAACLGAAGAAYAGDLDRDDAADIEQIGRNDDGHTPTDKSVIRQSGNGNTASIEQQAILGSHVGSFAEISQHGSNNKAGIDQSGKNDAALIVQYGDHNAATINQPGNNAASAVVQTGNNLGVQIDQSGHGGGIGVTQFGVGAPGAPPITIRQY